MKGPFITTDNDIKKYNIYLLLALVPLIIYGFYKNGIYLFLNNYINFMQMFKPIILILGSLLINILIQKIILKEKNIWNNINLLDGVIISMVIMPQVNIIVFWLLYLIFEFLFLFLNKKFNMNNIAFCKLCLLIIFLYVMKYNYLNEFEMSNNYTGSFKSLFFGSVSGGMCSTCNFIIIISWIFLSTNPLYKKEISLFMIITMALLCFVNFIISPNLTKSFLPLFSYSTLFCAIFISPHMKSSPYLKTSKIIYGILCGVISYILIVTTKSFISVILSISILSCFANFIDNFVQKLSYLNKN